MGLIKAGIGALGGTLADQWKKFFYCDALPNDVLMRKGKSVSAGVPPTQKVTITSSPTVPELPWRTVSA